MTDWTENAREPASAADVPHGFEIGYVEPVDGFVSLTATHRSPEPGRRLVLNGLVDVVPARTAQWTRDPWAAEVEDGRLTGAAVST